MSVPIYSCYWQGGCLLLEIIGKWAGWLCGIYQNAVHLTSPFPGAPLALGSCLCSLLREDDMA